MSHCDADRDSSFRARLRRSRTRGWKAALHTNDGTLIFDGYIDEGVGRGLTVEAIGAALIVPATTQ